MRAGRAATADAAASRDDHAFSGFKIFVAAALAMLSRDVLIWLMAALRGLIFFSGLLALGQVLLLIIMKISGARWADGGLCAGHLASFFAAMTPRRLGAGARSGARYGRRLSTRSARLLGSKPLGLLAAAGSACFRLLGLRLMGCIYDDKISAAASPHQATGRAGHRFSSLQMPHLQPYFRPKADGRASCRLRAKRFSRLFRSPPTRFRFAQRAPLLSPISQPILAFLILYTFR